MTVARVHLVDGPELRVFANALREFLGLDPLFHDGRSVDEDEREIARFYSGTFNHIPENNPRREWNHTVTTMSAYERLETDREFLVAERRFFPKSGRRRSSR